MTHNFKRCLAIALAMLVLCACAVAEVQLDRKGSISVRIHTAEGVNVQNARLEVYRVGDAVIRDHNLRFDPCSDFEGISLENPGDSGLVEKLNNHIRQADLFPMRQTVTNAEGMVKFENIETGLYLVRQNGFSGGNNYFSEITAFIVSVPMTQQNGWTYEVIAQPKVNALPAPTVKPTQKPVQTPTDPTLPQTGMLRWPVPVLGISGLVLFALGWALAFTGRKDRNA